MNDTVARIRHIQAQIKVIDRMIKSGEWKAAGLEIGINVGPRSEDYGFDAVVQLGIPSMDQGFSILNAIRQGLECSLAFNVGSLRREHDELSNMLKELGNESQSI